ncbi:MAG: hypothetical protein Q4D41_03230 [Prevotellaceae bacterium]|nr:hypothetical protein [Prevotellaceae bacterium]
MKKILLLALSALLAWPVCIKAQHGLVGFANYNDLDLNGTTGGGAGTVVRVNNRTDLAKYAGGSTPYVIIIENDLEGNGINDTNDYISIGSNKTIVGAGSGITLNGLGFDVKNQSNIIIRNIKVTNAKPDGMAFRTTHHVWIDHCDFSACDDGALDFTIGSSYLTVSWTKFHDHDKVSICNSGTQHFEDASKNRVTYHHCSFENTTQRNPRIGYGLGHIFNNYYTKNSSYCVGYHTRAKLIVENSYFYNTKEPFEQMYSDDPMTASYADILSRNNKFVSTSGNTTDTGVGFDTDMYYDYEFAMDDVNDVPTLAESTGLKAGIEYDLIPYPGDGAINIPTGTELWCGAVDAATEYIIKIGTSADNLTDYNAESFTLQPSTTYFWQATAVTPSANYESEIFRFTTASEKASMPQPANGETEAQLREPVNELEPCEPMTLRWSNAFDAVSYNVYIGTEEGLDEESISGTTTTTGYNPGSLSIGTNYYWRVDAVKADGSIVTGDTWNFSSPVYYADFGRTEMEHMVLSGRAFKEVENGKVYFKASNDTVTVGEAGPGSMSAIWNGKSTTCDITTTYFDENDGQGWYGIYVNDEYIDSWNATANNEKLMSHVTSGVDLETGDEIRIDFYTHNKMMSRTDCIDIAESSGASIKENIVTDIEEQTRIYTLDGRYVGNDRSSLKKGIYIINKRKVVIR